MLYKYTIKQINTELDKYRTTINNNIIKISELKNINESAMKLIEGQDKLLQNLIPTINRHNNQIKKLVENYQLLVMICEKIVSKIDPEYKSKTTKTNKTTKGK